MISPDEYAVRLVDLPVAVGGFITESPDGFTNIYINARHGNNGQHRSFRHELRHAENNDLHSSESLETIENRADGVDPRLKTIPQLMKARDLIPRQPSVSLPSLPNLSAHQIDVLINCLTELDRFCFVE